MARPQRRRYIRGMTTAPAPAPLPGTAPPPSREQLLYWLHEAAEIEHHLMCCYLYAAFSLKRGDPAWTPAQAAAVARWRGVLTGVALEEMSHLCLVGNLMSALGAPPHMGRPALPVDSGPYPAGFVIRLGGFCAATIEHFMYLERPAGETGADVHDGRGYEATGSYRRQVPAERLSPGPRDYATVGDLYALLDQSLALCSVQAGEAALFIGDPRLQVDASLAPLPGVAAVTGIASARAALHTIVTQGEGAGGDRHDSHFSRFAAVAAELRALLAEDPAFEPAWPVATNPVMNAPVRDSAERVHVSQPQIARWLDIGNALYTTSLRCLLQGYGEVDRAAKASWLSASFALMRALVPVGQGLAARPAQDGAAQPHAGLTFTPLRTLAALPRERAAHVVAERLAQLRERALQLPLVPVAGESEATWPRVIEVLAQQQAALAALAGEAPLSPATTATPVASPAVAAATPAPLAAASVPATDPVETVVGSGITVHFEGRRCIHSRHCVLEAPSVFKANTPGAWIFPDTVAVEALVAVAHNCPSGAIRYSRHDGGPAEPAPPVNTLRVRENGPYAVHAPIVLAGADDGHRATLCRCGQSRRKPWCDGSHVGAAFQASGEPPTGATEALAVRDGPLHVTPLANGPLQVQGNLEICAGTGRTVARITEARLCRCGQSRNKPFCDLSHVAAGFVAEGA
jgi:CDGSH-type Zn-finger protein/uncharacterized Fe-S cluster protein YjdI